MIHKEWDREKNAEKKVRKPTSFYGEFRLNGGRIIKVLLQCIIKKIYSTLQTQYVVKTSALTSQ